VWAFLEVAGGIRSLVWSMDSNKLTYLDFFCALPCNSAPFRLLVPVFKDLAAAGDAMKMLLEQLYVMGRSGEGARSAMVG